MKTLIALAREWLGFAAVLATLMFGFNTLAFAAFHVPSESMLPTLQVGDHFHAAKYAYGYSRWSTPLFTLPLPEGRILADTPARGDIVVFRKDGQDEAVVKRVIGLPGETVQVSGGRLYIDGAQVERREVLRYAYRERGGGPVSVVEYEEVLPGGRAHRIMERSDDGPADDTPVYRVPDGHVFVMGDNRDNSLDSRFAREMGTVPLDHLLGRVGMVNFCFRPCEAEPGLACPGGGFRDRLLVRVR